MISQKPEVSDFNIFQLSQNSEKMTKKYVIPTIFDQKHTYCTDKLSTKYLAVPGNIPLHCTFFRHGWWIQASVENESQNWPLPMNQAIL